MQPTPEFRGHCAPSVPPAGASVSVIEPERTRRALRPVPMLAFVKRGSVQSPEIVRYVGGPIERESSRQSLLLAAAGAAQRWLPMTRWSRLMGRVGAPPATWRGERIEELPLRWATIERAQGRQGDRRPPAGSSRGSRRCLAEATRGTVDASPVRRSPGCGGDRSPPGRERRRTILGGSCLVAGAARCADRRTGRARVHGDHGVPGPWRACSRRGRVDAASVGLGRAVRGVSASRLDCVEYRLERPVVRRSPQHLDRGRIGESGEQREEGRLTEDQLVRDRGG